MIAQQFKNQKMAEGKPASSATPGLILSACLTLNLLWTSLVEFVLILGEA